MIQPVTSCSPASAHAYVPIMITVSGVIMRCINFVPTDWTLSTMVLEHTLAVVHAASFCPMSWDALQMSHPAYLPLISVRDTALVECEVVDMASSITSSPQYFSLALMESIMFVPMATLATTCSIVQMVMTASGVNHLRSGRYLWMMSSTF